MKKLRRSLCVLAALVCLACGVFAAAKVVPAVIDGYRLYAAAIEEKSLCVRVAELRADEHYVPLAQISQEYLTRVVESEDHRFYAHFGVDPIGIARALLHNLMRGASVEGGSTITQQLAKNLLFSNERSLTRKIAELIATFELEQTLTKDEILELYCNITYFGEDCYGIYEAATYYYGVLPAELDGEEAGALVYTLPAPSYRNPFCAAA